MRFIRVFALLVLIIIGGYYLFEKNDQSPQKAVDDFSSISETKENMLETKQIPEERSTIPLEGDIFQWIDKSTDELIEALGEPVRKDQSGYGYDW